MLPLVRREIVLTESFNGVHGVVFTADGVPHSPRVSIPREMYHEMELTYPAEIRVVISRDNGQPFNEDLVAQESGR